MSGVDLEDTFPDDVRFAHFNNMVASLPIVSLSWAEFAALKEYSTTLPTGQTIGKQWKRQLYYGKYNYEWLLCEYIEDADPTKTRIISKRITIKLVEPS